VVAYPLPVQNNYIYNISITGNNSVLRPHATDSKRTIDNTII